MKKRRTRATKKCFETDKNGTRSVLSDDACAIFQKMPGLIADGNALKGG